MTALQAAAVIVTFLAGLALTGVAQTPPQAPEPLSQQKMELLCSAVQGISAVGTHPGARVCREFLVAKNTGKLRHIFVQPESLPSAEDTPARVVPDGDKVDLFIKLSWLCDLEDFPYSARAVTVRSVIINEASHIHDVLDCFRNPIPGAPAPQGLGITLPRFVWVVVDEAESDALTTQTLLFESSTVPLAPGKLDLFVAAQIHERQARNRAALVSQTADRVRSTFTGTQGGAAVIAWIEDREARAQQFADTATANTTDLLLAWLSCL